MLCPLKKKLYESLKIILLMQCLYSYWLFNRALVYMGANNAAALFWLFFGNRLSVSNISNKYSAPLIFNQSTVCRRVQYSSYVKINLKLLWHVSWIYLFDRKRSTFCNRLDSLSSRFWCVPPLLVWELDSAAARDYIYGQHLFVDITVKYWILKRD